MTDLYGDFGGSDGMEVRKAKERKIRFFSVSPGYVGEWQQREESISCPSLRLL